MRALITIAALLTVATLLTGFDFFWTDYVVEIKQTSVHNTALGSDVHRILVVHRDEAHKLTDYANTYNKIAYNNNLSKTEICAELEKTAMQAIEQREKSFVSKYEVKCFPDTTLKAPELKMVIWPQVRHDYRFIITFKPTP